MTLHQSDQLPIHLDAYYGISEEPTLAKFNKIPEARAPKPTRTSGRLNARMREYEDYLKSLKSGEVAQVTPDAGESARGIALRIGRAARRLGHQAESWIVDGTVYAKIS